MIGAVPVHVPSLVVSVLPSSGVPETAGGDWFEGAAWRRRVGDLCEAGDGREHDQRARERSREELCVVSCRDPFRSFTWLASAPPRDLAAERAEVSRAGLVDGHRDPEPVRPTGERRLEAGAGVEIEARRA